MCVWGGGGGGAVCFESVTGLLKTALCVCVCVCVCVCGGVGALSVLSLYLDC